MDDLMANIIIELMGVSFHNILYRFRLYPSSIFDKRRKYGVPVYESIHPEINEYLNNFLKVVQETLLIGELEKIQFILHDDNGPLYAFIFEIIDSGIKTRDVYMLDCEQKIRNFCLKLSSLDSKDSHISGFKLLIHCKQTSAIALTKNQDLTNFPMVYNDNVEILNVKIIPLQNVDFEHISLQIYMECYIVDSVKASA